jgi:hypothetical protein
MSSISLPDLIGPETADAILAALRTVAERSFFADVEPCDDRTFGRLTSGMSSWLVATVRFEEGTAIGALSCTLPDALATALFEAFTGHDPSTAEPRRADVLDLVGEFANMVCGAWLSRLSDNCLFELRVPAVTRMTAGWTPLSDSNGREGLICRMVTINELPMRILIRAN